MLYFPGLTVSVSIIAHNDEPSMNQGSAYIFVPPTSCGRPPVPERGKAAFPRSDQGLRDGAMQDPGYKLPKIHLPITWVNEGKKRKGGSPVH